MPEPLPVPAAASPASLGDAGRQVWCNFIGLTALAIASLGVLAPVGVAVGGARWAWHRRRPAPA